MKKVIIELIEDTGYTLEAATNSEVAKLDGFTMDESYDPVPIGVAEDTVEVLEMVKDGKKEAILIRGEVDEDKIAELEELPNVLNVWDDGRIEVFSCDDPSEYELEEDNELISGEPSEVISDSGVVETSEAAFDLELASPCPPTDCATPYRR